MATQREDRRLALLRRQVADDIELDADFIARCAKIFNRPSNKEFAQQVRLIIFGICYRVRVGPRDIHADLEIWKLLAEDPLSSQTLARLSEDTSAAALVRSYFAYLFVGQAVGPIDSRSKKRRRIPRTITSFGDIIALASDLKVAGINAIAMHAEVPRKRRPTNHGFHRTMEEIVRAARAMGDDLKLPQESAERVSREGVYPLYDFASGLLREGISRSEASGGILAGAGVQWNILDRPQSARRKALVRALSRAKRDIQKGEASNPIIMSLSEHLVGVTKTANGSK